MNETIAMFAACLDYLGEMFGASTEIALYDLGKGNQALVKLVHPGISGKREQTPVPDYLKEFIEQGAQTGQSCFTGIVDRATGGGILYAGAYLIRDARGSIVGVLDISRDVSAYRMLEDAVSNLMDAYIPGGSQDVRTRGVFAARADFDARALDEQNAVMPKAVGIAVAEACGLIDRDPLTLSPEERIEIIRSLNADGVFLLKGAVVDVAQAMGISVPTVYRYLQQVRRQTNR